MMADKVSESTWEDKFDKFIYTISNLKTILKNYSLHLWTPLKMA